MVGNAALLVDLYELTMAHVYFRHKRTTRATFDLFARQLPVNRSFLIAAGLDDILAYIRALRFTPDAIKYLRSLGLFSRDFLRYLARFRFTGDIWAMPEGTVFFPNEPVLRVTAPIMEAQMVEGFLLNTINLQSMIASKAARVVLAARGRAVYDFSLRRTHGADASIKVARSSYLAGFQGTSNVLAGKLYGIGLSGTMAHSFVMAFDSESESFRAYAGVFGSRTILLVDTYDVPEGIRNAIRTAQDLEAKGERLFGIRLDSGPLVTIARRARRMLDAAGLRYVKIIASGNLDERAIGRMIAAGAPVDSFGVGTHMGTSSDAPVLDVIYKMSEVTDMHDRFVPVMKFSTGKVTLPGRKQVYRRVSTSGMFVKDIVALAQEKTAGIPLLIPVVRNGAVVYNIPGLGHSRRYASESVARLPALLKRIDRVHPYPVTLSGGLKALAAHLARTRRMRQ
jgi:nicotinate phosphoribosyltransferase